MMKILSEGKKEEENDFEANGVEVKTKKKIELPSLDFFAGGKLF